MTDRPAAVRFYFDADLLGVAKVVAALRHDVARARENVQDAELVRVAAYAGLRLVS